MTTASDLYLDLLKRALTRALFEDSDRVLGFNDWRHTPTLKRRVGDRVAAGAARFGVEIVKRRPYEEDLRLNGVDWPARAETMIGLRRLDNIKDCVEAVLADGVPGDLVETGVWRGGGSIFMRGILKVHGVTDRTVWACDSFEGLPAPNALKYPKDTGDIHHTYDALAVGVDQVRHNFRRYGLLDDQVQFVVGWFSDTLPTMPAEQIAVLRLDGDMYESTMDALAPLYPRLSPGGFCIIDDWQLAPCRAAVEDYRREHGITEEVQLVGDGSGAFWRRSS